jgi:aspartyl/asparaginyl-tRNA synthetase
MRPDELAVVWPCAQAWGKCGSRKMHHSVLQEEVAVAGRIMARRFMGKLAFMSLVDDSGSIQIYLDKAVIDGTSGEDTFKWVLRPLQAYSAQRLSCLLLWSPLRPYYCY